MHGAKVKITLMTSKVVGTTKFICKILKSME